MINNSKSGIDDNWNCVDCQKDCSVDDKDYYMVKKDVWEKYGVGKKMLCMDCLEERMGENPYLLHSNDNCELLYTKHVHPLEFVLTV